MVPDYGPAEVPQAFCRVAAVHGAIYVLRCPLKSVLLSEDGQLCTGVRLQTGQVGSAPQSTGLIPLYNADVLYYCLHFEEVLRAFLAFGKSSNEGHERKVLFHVCNI